MLKEELPLDKAMKAFGSVSARACVSVFEAAAVIHDLVATHFVHLHIAFPGVSDYGAPTSQQMALDDGLKGCPVPCFDQIPRRSARASSPKVLSDGHHPMATRSCLPTDTIFPCSEECLVHFHPVEEVRLFVLA
jgi:hypothetical protein